MRIQGKIGNHRNQMKIIQEGKNQVEARVQTKITMEQQ
jgi:hypothetical protein